MKEVTAKRLSQLKDKIGWDESLDVQNVKRLMMELIDIILLEDNPNFE